MKCCARTCLFVCTCECEWWDAWGEHVGLVSLLSSFSEGGREGRLSCHLSLWFSASTCLLFVLVREVWAEGCLSLNCVTQPFLTNKWQNSLLRLHLHRVHCKPILPLSIPFLSLHLSLLLSFPHHLFWLLPHVLYVFPHTFVLVTF